MAVDDLVVLCKYCSQEIHYLRQPEKGMGYIECPKCKCSIDQEGNVANKPVIAPNMQIEIDKFLVDHKQLHDAFALEDLDNYYEFQKYYDRHESLIKELESRNVYHKSCEDFLDDYRKFDKQELKNVSTNINEVAQELKSFKLKDPFIYISKSNNIVINSTKEDFDKAPFMKVAVYKALRMLPRTHWGAFKFLSKETKSDDNVVEQPICELGCLRTDTVKNNISNITLKGEILKQAQNSFAQDKIELNKFFMSIRLEPYILKESKIVSSDFIEKDFPVYVRKNISGIDCQIHKDNTNILIYSNKGEDLSKLFPKIINAVKELKISNAVLAVTLKEISAETFCYVNDILYSSDNDIHKHSFSDRKKVLDLIGIRKSSFEPIDDGYYLNKSPYIVCKKQEEIEKAIERISQTKDFIGVVVNTDMPYSLKHQQLGIFVYNTVSKGAEKKSCDCGQNVNETSIICNFLNCEIKDIYINVMRISGVEAGNIFSAIQEMTKKFTLVETRNFNGGETPPIYQEIRLKKNLSKVFLIEGTRFYYDDIKNTPFIIQCYPVWGGYQARFVSHVNAQDFNIELKKHIVLYAHENNFLRNEKFSVSGEFIDEQTIEWEDLKLAEPVKDKLKKLESLIKKNDPSIDSRGLIFIGPPGCGKTLTGKLLSKLSPTFIWVTAKDCSDIGATNAFSTAFSLARDLRPSILFMEDIDSYIEYGMVDLLKTELDGMKLNNGVFTILTSNFPELLPEALIDRPGRFHDIIYFTLPDAEIRKEMLKHFLKEDVSQETLDIIVKQTENFSGAHIKEICRFAQIIQREDNIDLNSALLKSLAKLIEQRELIQDLKNKNKD